MPRFHTLRLTFLRLLLVLCTTVVFPQAVPCARGWWDTGHQHITTGAVSHLPEPLRYFFQNNADSISTYSGYEPPGSHWIDLDAYPEFFEGTLSPYRSVLIDLHDESFVNANGTAPWTYIDYVDDLSSLMASATSPADWLALIPTAGAQAHYIEDLHNPLHLTTNYNGQETGNYGIHSRYEGGLYGDISTTSPSPLAARSTRQRSLRTRSMKWNRTTGM